MGNLLLDGNTEGVSRSACWRCAKLRKSLDDLRFLKRLVYRLVKAHHHFAGSTTLDGETNVILDDEFGKALFNDGWHILHTCHAIRSGYGQCAKPARFDEICDGNRG